MAIAVKNADEFALLLQQLIYELTECSTKFKIYCGLLYAENGQYRREIEQSPVFWTFTQRALLDSALICLCRIYDQESNALSLRNWLETAEQNPNFFMSPLNNVQLDADKDEAGQSNPNVKKLIIWRNNLFAHRGPKYILRGINPMEKEPLTNKEIEALIERALSILNKYFVLFRDTSASIDLFGDNDFEFVLGCIRLEMERRDSNLALIKAELATPLPK